MHLWKKIIVHPDKLATSWHSIRFQLDSNQEKCRPLHKARSMQRSHLLKYSLVFFTEWNGTLSCMNFIVLLNAILCRLNQGTRCFFKNGMLDCWFLQSFYSLGDSPWTDHRAINNYSPNHDQPTLLKPKASWTHVPVSHPTFTPTIWSFQGGTSLVCERYLGEIDRNIVLCPFNMILLMNFPWRRLLN